MAFGIKDEAEIARRQGLERYTTQFPCKRGHTVRYAKCQLCVECVKGRYDPVKQRESMARYVAKDPEKYRKIVRDWQIANQPRMKAYNQKYILKIKSEKGDK